MPEFHVLPIAVGLGLTLQGCASTSFAPPPVVTNQAVSRVAPGRCIASLAGGIETRTTTESRVVPGIDKEGHPTSKTVQTVKVERIATQESSDDGHYGMLPKNVEGALALIDNFLLAYRCAAHEAADGRQMFQVPSFLAAVAAASGVAFGLNENQILGLGIASTVFKGGNGYYAPKDKATYLDRAIDAVDCIKTESVGVTFFNTDESSAPRFIMENAGEGGSITISANRKYHEMVAASLFSVERVLASRLSGAGNADFSSVLEEVKTLVPKAEPTPAQQRTIQAALAGDGTRTAEAITIDLDLLRPRLQLCVLRSKL